MKILFTNATRAWGGVKSWTVRLIRELTASGHEAAVVARNGTGFLDQARAAGAVAIPFRFGMDYLPVTIGRACVLLGRMRPDVVVTNISKELRSFGLAARMLGIPVVARLGLSGDVRDHVRTRFEYRYVVSGILVPSPSVRDGLPPAVVDRSRVHIVPNGIPIPRLPQRAYDGPLRVLHLGSISARKGVDILCGALARLLDEGVELAADLAGEGALLDPLREQYRGYPAIRFLGHQADPSPLLEAAHIGVLHSANEGFPNSLLEYMAHGLAAVTTPVDGIPELVAHDRTGLLIPFGQGGELAESLRRLIRHPGDIQRLGAAARQHVERHFTMARQAEAVVAVLERYVKGPLRR